MADTKNKPLSAEEILSLLPANIYWKSKEGYYQGCNEQQARTANLGSPEAVIGKTLYDIFPKDIADKITETDNAIMEHGEETVAEEKALDANGDPVIYFSRKIPIKNEDGEVVGLAGISVDITKRKRYEDALKHANLNDDFPDLEEIIGILPGNIYWKNREGIYLGCNDNMAKLINLPSRHDYVGMTLHDFGPKEIADRITAIDEAIMESGEPSCSEEEAIDADDKPATLFTRKVPLKNKNGKVIGLAGVSIDITDRKRYEVALKLAKEKAEIANKTKSDFIMNMSHDIRTPFSGILGLSQFLFEKETNAEKKDILDCIVESSRNLLDVLNEVIFLATFDKEPETSTTRISLLRLIESVFAIMRPEAMRKGLTYTLDVDPNIPEHVTGDEFGTKRVLLNLIGNAIKFTDSGTVHISVETTEITNDQAKLQFIIRDSGIGIPDDKLEIIFEQFSRLVPSYKGKYQGTGLGLWFVKQLLVRMCGDIRVESEVGKGSAFIFTIPFTLIA